MQPIPEEFITLQELPRVPSQGDNAALLDWAQECAVSNRLYEQQMRALREIK